MYGVTVKWVKEAVTFVTNTFCNAWLWRDVVCGLVHMLDKGGLYAIYRKGKKGQVSL